MYKNVFSEFEVVDQAIKFDDENEYVSMECVGKSEEELNTKTIIKKCRGVEKKRKTKGTGTGTLTESLHVPYYVYNKMYDMTKDYLKDGVTSYGTDNCHNEFALVQKVIDEDDNIKYKAYPRCVINHGPKRPVENGAEEVPELELGMDLLPDDYGQCMYEAVLEELTDDDIKEWMTKFTPKLARKVTGEVKQSDEASA